MTIEIDWVENASIKGNWWADRGQHMLHVEFLDGAWRFSIEWTDPPEDCNEDIPGCNTIDERAGLHSAESAKAEAEIAYRRYIAEQYPDW